MTKEERHLAAAETHDEAATRHAETAAYWQSKGDQELAALELRNAEVERLAAEIERDRAALVARRDSGGQTGAVST